MATEYVEQLAALFDAVKPKLPRGHGLGKKQIKVKHVFGGAVGFIDGHIFHSLTKVGLALKLSEKGREQLFRTKQAKRLRYFSKAPIKKQYASFPKTFADNDRDSVKTWIQRSIEYVLTAGV